MSIYNSHRVCWLIVACSSALPVKSDDSFLQSRELASHSESKQVAKDAPILMRWDFVPGETILVESHITEEATDTDGEQFTTHRIYNYRWHIEDVDQKDVATIGLTCDRVRIDSEWFRFSYDSKTDDPLSEDSEEERANFLIRESRSLLASKIGFRVTPTGSVFNLTGDEALTAAQQFTPGDMAVLPDAPVRSAESWTVRTESSVVPLAMCGRAIYTLAGVREIESGVVCIIGGISEIQELSGGLVPRFEPIVSESHFDLSRGQFVREVLSTESEVKTPQGLVKMHIRTERTLAPSRSLPVRDVATGSYLFTFDDSQPIPLVIDGRRFATLAAFAESLNRDKHLKLEFFTTWNDANHNDTPDYGEVLGGTTRFNSEVPVQFLLKTIGLKNARIDLCVVDSEGDLVLNHKINIKGEDWFVMRSLSEFAADVYSFEFYLDGRYLLRIPVQVYTRTK